MPAQAVEVQIAEAIVAGLNAAYFSSPYQRITAVRRDVPEREGQQLSTLQVSVVTPGHEAEQATRQGDLYTYQTAIVLARHVRTQQDADDIRRLRQEIVDVIRSGIATFSSMPEDVKFMRAMTETSFERDTMLDRNVMLCSIGVEHRVVRYWIQPLGGPTGATGATGP